MKNITIKVGTDTIECHAPEKWDEVGPQEFIYLANHPITPDKVPCPQLINLLHIPYDKAIFILPIHFDAIHQHLQWIDDMTPIRSWMIPCVRLNDGREMLPPASNFDNVTWEEFIFADELASRGRFDALSACLYRPADPEANENTESRIPFTRQGANNRLSAFRDLNPAVINAIGINYLILRKHMTKKYRHLFAKSKGDSKSAGGWVEVSRAILRENVWQERNLLTTSCSQVLYRLDNEIKESKKRQRDERRK